MNDDLAFQVDLFADLMVRLDDPFAAREAVLVEEALDEDRCRSLVEGWRGRFERDATGGLAARFADEYATRRAAFVEARGREASGEAPAEDARFLNADAQTFREEAARVAREPLVEMAAPALAAMPVLAVMPVLAAASSPVEAPVRASMAARFGGTTDLTEAVMRASLPFAPGPAVAPPPLPAPPRPHLGSGTTDISASVPRERLPFAVDKHLAEPMGAPVLARPDARLSGTTDISAFVPRAATPFVEPATRRRLIRFDPQTGQPLPAPIWVELPPEPPEPGAPNK